MTRLVAIALLLLSGCRVVYDVSLPDGGTETRVFTLTVKNPEPAPTPAGDAKGK